MPKHRPTIIGPLKRMVLFLDIDVSNGLFSSGQSFIREALNFVRPVALVSSTDWRLFASLPGALIQRALEGFDARIHLERLSLFNEEGQLDLVV